MIEINSETQRLAKELAQQLTEAAQDHYGPNSADSFAAGYFKSLVVHLIGLLPNEEAERQMQLLNSSITQLQRHARRRKRLP